MLDARRGVGLSFHFLVIEGNSFLCYSSPQHYYVMLNPNTENSLPVSKQEYPHRDALVPALLPGLVRDLSSQEEVITIAANRLLGFSSERRTYIRTSYHSLYNEV